MDPFFYSHFFHFKLSFFDKLICVTIFIWIFWKHFYVITFVLIFSKMPKGEYFRDLRNILQTFPWKAKTNLFEIPERILSLQSHWQQFPIEMKDGICSNSDRICVDVFDCVVHNTMYRIWIQQGKNMKTPEWGHDAVSFRKLPKQLIPERIWPMPKTWIVYCICICIYIKCTLHIST